MPRLGLERSVVGLLMGVAGAAAGQTPPAGSAEPLTAALADAFHVPVAARVSDSGRVLAVVIDAPPTTEWALRVAQFAGAHYDSASHLAAIEVRFEHDERKGQFLNSHMHPGGAFLPSTLPADTTPGWVQRMLAPSPIPTLKVELLRPATDTFTRSDGFSTVVALADTTVAGRSLWRVAAESRSTNGKTIATDVVTIDRTTLRPVDERRIDITETETAHYDEAHVSTTLTDRDETLRFDTTFVAVPFSDTELDLLLSTLPLAKGYATRLPVFRLHQRQNGFGWVSILVRGLDTSRNAWIIDAAGTATGYRRHWINRRPTLP